MSRRTSTTYPGDGAYPGRDSIDQYAENACSAAFASYTGRSATDDPIYSYGYLIPTPDGWTGGDKGITCYLARLDGGMMTGSIRAAP